VNVLCAFDPNDKGVSPQGDGSAHRVDMDSELRFLVRFQNTGNDTAFNVLITDTLAAGIDAGSVQVIASSHPCWVQRSNGNILRFYFTNIQLPDSNVNEAESHGYVLFSCKGNSMNMDPTVVTNSANIYFDANPPVITNSTLTTFSNLSTAVSGTIPGFDLKLSISPQPCRDYCMVRLGNHVDQGRYFYTITDIEGKTTLLSGNFIGQSATIPCNGLSSGIYVLEVTEQSGLSRGACRLLVE
jgi:uncharacterized repeat protein (TIGR01451 family)